MVKGGMGIVELGLREEKGLMKIMKERNGDMRVEKKGIGRMMIGIWMKKRGIGGIGMGMDEDESLFLSGKIGIGLVKRDMIVERIEMEDKIEGIEMMVWG